MTRLWDDDGEPTDRCIEAFTEGDCWALAAAICEKTPLELYLVAHGDHWIAGDGKLFIDIEGIHTAAQLMRRWNTKQRPVLASQHDLKIATRDLWNALFSFSNLLDIDDVLSAADRVIEKHADRLELVMES